MKKTHDAFLKKFLYLLPLSEISKAFLLSLLIFTLNSCNKDCNLCCKPCIKFPCCVDGRRPAVIETEYSDIIDFDACDPGCDDCDDKGGTFKGAKLPHEYFDPHYTINQEYRVAKGDVLEIAVIEDKDTSVDTVVVAPDGFIYYLFLAGIQAEGRTISEIRRDLEVQLRAYFTEPVVAVVPRFISNQTYVILGRVKTPGVYPITYPLKVRDAIGQAGGVYVESYEQISLQPRGSFYEGFSSTKKTLSKLDNAFLMRKGERINIDFNRLVYHGDESQNIYLQPGDYIYIAAEEHKRVFIVGAVQTPRAIPYTDHLTLMGAIASSAGWTLPLTSPYSGDLHRVLIVRGSLECPRLIHVDVGQILIGKARDVFLCPGDIVYVQNKQLRFGRELVRLAIFAYLQGFMTTASTNIALDLFPVGGDDE